MDIPETITTVGITGISVWGVLKWSLGRNLAALEEKLKEAHEKADKTNAERKAEAEARAHARVLEATEKTALQGELKTAMSTLAELKGAFDQWQKSLEQSRDKSAAALKEELKERDHKQREYTGQVFGPIDLRVGRIEAKLEVDADQKKRR